MGHIARLAYADDGNLLGNNKDIIKKNTETLSDTSKEVGLEVNTEKIKYTLLSRHQNAGQIHDIKIANESFANMTQVQIFVNDSNKSKFGSEGN
jgi:hypothetical protein